MARQSAGRRTGRATTGKTMLAGGTGYEIQAVGERTITVRDYPIIECDEITLLHDAWRGPE